MHNNNYILVFAISGTLDYKSGKLFGVRKRESSTGANQALKRDESLVYLRYIAFL